MDSSKLNLKVVMGPGAMACSQKPRMLAVGGNKWVQDSGLSLCRPEASIYKGLASALSASVVEHGLLSSSGTQAQQLQCGGFVAPAACGILVPQLGIKPVSPALEGGLLTTEPPAKFQYYFLQVHMNQ